jgi:hypothetical protein
MAYLPVIKKEAEPFGMDIPQDSADLASLGG